MGGVDEFAKSIAEYGRRFAQRWYLLLPGLVGAIAVVANLVGVHLKLPDWVPWAVIGGSFFAANLWAFHDVRVERDSAVTPRDVRRRIERELGTIIIEGERLTDEYRAEGGPYHDEANRWAVDWWNRAGEFVETTLGVGERHVISKPTKESVRTDWIAANCELLRGVIERLPQADVRVDEAGLREAIAVRRRPPEKLADGAYSTPLEGD